MKTSSHVSFYASLLNDVNTLAALGSAYGKPAEPISPVTVTRTANVDASALMTPRPRPTGTRVVSTGSRSIKAKSAPIPSAAVAVDAGSKGFKLPAAGSIDAPTFLSTLRVAGKRVAVYESDYTDNETGETFAAGSPRLNDKGAPIMVHDAKIQIADERAAIAAFVGWHMGEPHGTQLDSARRTAHAHLSKAARLEAGGKVDGFGYRSPEAHEAKWSAPAWVKGLPAPIAKLVAHLGGRERMAVEDLALFGKLRELATMAGQPLPEMPIFEGELTEEQLIDAQDEHAAECERVTAEKASALATFEAVIAKEFKSSKGVKPILSTEAETLGETVDYEVIEVGNPIVNALRPFFTTQTLQVKTFKREIRTWHNFEGLTVALASLEALAAARLYEVQSCLDAVDATNPTAEQVERAHRAMEDMLAAGRTVTIEEAVIEVYDTASRSRASLPIGAKVSVSAVERVNASDEHGILNTQVRA